MWPAALRGRWDCRGLTVCTHNLQGWEKPSWIVHDGFPRHQFPCTYFWTCRADSSVPKVLPQGRVLTFAPASSSSLSMFVLSDCLNLSASLCVCVCVCLWCVSVADLCVQVTVWKWAQQHSVQLQVDHPATGFTFTHTRTRARSVTSFLFFFFFFSCRMLVKVGRDGSDEDEAGRLCCCFPAWPDDCSWRTRWDSSHHHVTLLTWALLPRCSLYRCCFVAVIQSMSGRTDKVFRWFTAFIWQ